MAAAVFLPNHQNQVFGCSIKHSCRVWDPVKNMVQPQVHVKRKQ
jgi:hypothetical protein